MPFLHEELHMFTLSSKMKLENIEEEGPVNWLPAAAFPAPETPTESMEFLARSWSVSATELSKALSCNGHGHGPEVNSLVTNSIHKEQPLIKLFNSDPHHSPLPTTPTINKIDSSNTQTQTSSEAVPSIDSLPPVSPPRKSDDSCKELFLLHQALNQDLLSNPQLLRNGIYKGMMKGRTMGRWLKDQKERKKQEHRTLTAHLHAAVSVAGVAAAVAAIAASSAVSDDNKLGPIQAPSKTSSAIASAAALVASHCIEIAEEMGADHAHILSVVSSAINAKTNGDVMALTAAAATALRGAATLKARQEKGSHGHGSASATMALGCEEQISDERKETSFLTALNFVSKGGELLKRTRKGDLHWKNVSININSKLQVVAKMKSKHMAGTFTKKKKYVLSDTCSDIGAWIGRDEAEERDGERRAYFGMKTADRVIEFECRNKGEKQMWVDGIQYLLHCKASMA